MAHVYEVAIAGLGKRGKVHADVFHRSSRFKVVGLSDVDKERYNDAAALCDNPPFFADAKEMLAETKPDVFCFCTPPSVRLPLIKMGVDAGVKLIAYEKPMATNMTEALEMKKLLDASGVKSVQSHQRKYNIQFVKAKEVVDSGALGRIHTVYATGTGWMMHLATHLADYMRWFAGSEAEWVIGQAVGRGKLTDNHPSPDYLGGFIQFANGVRGIMEVGEFAPDVPEVEYWWRKVRFVVQGTEGFVEVHVGGGWRAVTKSRGAEGSDEGTWDADCEQVPYIEDIALWLDGTKEHPCSGEDGFKDVEIMCGLIRSAVERKKIDFPLGPGTLELELLEKTLPA
jgi:predicted dehydrogenase